MLTEVEIAATAGVEASTLTDAEAIASLTETQRQKVFDLQVQRDAIVAEIEAARSSSNQDSPELQAWTSLGEMR